MTDTSILGDVPLFKDLDESYLKDISEMFITARVPASRTIIEQGDEGYRFYIIIRGKVAVTVTDDDENTLHVATLEDGDYFGEIALIARTDRTATITADTDLRCLGMTSWDFRPLVESNGKIAWKLMRALARKIQEADARS